MINRRRLVNDLAYRREVYRREQQKAILKRKKRNKRRKGNR
jgi:hypothetical protein